MSYSNWNIPLERQQYLAHAIATVLQTLQTQGHTLPVTQENVAWMMQQIGAQSYEANFVAAHMNHHFHVSFGSAPPPKRPCPNCGGRCRLKCSSCFGEGGHRSSGGWYQCGICNGKGDNVCVVCNGKGYVI